VNLGYGAELNPNTPDGQGLTVNGQPSGGDISLVGRNPANPADYGLGGNPANRGSGPPGMPGGNTIPGGGGGPAGGAPGAGGQGGQGGPGNDWDDSLDFGGLNGLDTDFTGAAARGADAAYKGATQFMDGDFTKERDQAKAQLVAQGLQPGSEAFESQMERIERGQNAARTNAAFTAQGVGHQQSGDLLLRALQTRQQGVNEGFGKADRRLAGRGQDIGDRNTNRGLDLSRDSTGLNATLANRRFGLDEDNQSFQQLMQLIAQSRGGVNMPNFGAPGSLDVTGANSIAANNANAAAGRGAANNNMWAGLAGNLFGGLFK
jgi:hypothetical protein